MFGAASLDFACVASGKANGTLLYTKINGILLPEFFYAVKPVLLFMGITVNTYLIPDL